MPNSPEVEKIVDERVKIYGMAYEGILPPDAIERSKAHWRNELLDFAERITTKHQEELEKAVEAIEEEMRNLYSTMLREFVKTGLATEKQWNDSISPAMKRLGNVVRGLPPDAVTARVYKYPKQTYCNGEPCICGITPPTKTDKTTDND